MKYNVTFARFGSADVEADSRQEAMAKARSLATGEVDWSDDWEPTDADEAEGGSEPDPDGRPTAFFDMDGTISAPLFRLEDGRTATGFYGQEWIDFCNARSVHAYDNCVPVEPMLDFARRLARSGYETRILTLAMSEGEKLAKLNWLMNHPDIQELFDTPRFVRNADEKIQTVLDAGEGSLLVDDDLILLADAHGRGARTIHVSHVAAGLAGAIAGIEPYQKDPIETAAKEAAGCRNVCFMANRGTTARRAYELWTGMDVENAFLLTGGTPIPELERDVQAIRKLQEDGRPVHVACTPVLETGVDLDFEDFYREASTLNHMVQASARHNRRGRYEYRPMRIFRTGVPEKQDGEGHDGAKAGTRPGDAGSGPSFAAAAAKAAGEALVEAKDALSRAAKLAAGGDAARTARAKAASALAKAVGMLEKR